MDIVLYRCRFTVMSEKVCKLQSSYICGEIKNQIKNNEAYNGTKIGNYFGILLSGKT